MLFNVHRLFAFVVAGVTINQIILYKNFAMSRYWSKITKQLTPYTPGEQPQVENLIKLNTNENPYGPSPSVLEAIAAANNNDLRKYPDPTCADLQSAVANYYHLETDQVFIGNSSDEVLAHIFQALLKHESPLLFPDITYSFYPVYCGLYEIEFKKIPLADDFTLDIQDYDQPNGGIIFANPNAPTGIALPIEDLTKLLQSNTKSVVVVDEAYVDFSKQSAIALIDQFPNLLVTQTLSKSRSLAGLRVGFAFGNANLIEALNRVKNSFHPYALGKLQLVGALAAFTDDAYFNASCARIIAGRSSTTQQLRELGFSVLDSSCNFVFASHPYKSAAGLYQGLRKRGILVRHFDLPRISNHLRITIGTNEEMVALLAALQELLRQ